MILLDLTPYMLDTGKHAESAEAVTSDPLQVFSFVGTSKIIAF
jgi:hypothetical protein